MGFVQVFLLGVGLSMDAFAAAVCKGLEMKRINWRHTLIIALFFGGFQALMPYIGWLLGAGLKDYITAVDHYIAFALLAFIGGKMLWDVLRPQHEDEKEKAATEAGGGSDGEKSDIKQLLLMAIATSIDALVVGITFALEDVESEIYANIIIIGCTTFALSVLGVITGEKFGSRFEKKAQIAGGIILIAIGVKILLEHLGVFG